MADLAPLPDPVDLQDPAHTPGPAGPDDLSGIPDLAGTPDPAGTHTLPAAAVDGGPSGPAGGVDADLEQPAAGADRTAHPVRTTGPVVFAIAILAGLLLRGHELLHAAQTDGPATVDALIGYVTATAAVCGAGLLLVWLGTWLADLTTPNQDHR